MRPRQFLDVVLLLAATSAAAPATINSGLLKLNLTSATQEDFAQNALDVAMARIPQNSTTGCTKDTVAVRKYWGDLSAEERIEYTDAVQCLQKKQANSPSDLIEGAKTRYDDWVATHINQTFIIHMTASHLHKDPANFLSWHRWFTWEYEQALRNECGYTGYQPYWDWTKTAETGLESSPLFDGSATSLSGNGAPVAHAANSTVIVNGDSATPIILPPGTGGGCVTSGPFVNMTVNLGPVGLTLFDGMTAANDNKYAYNPRCLKRDLTDYSNTRHANATSLLTLLSQSYDVYDFQMTMQGWPNTAELGVHGGGHYALGGDPARDFFVSPGDPAFFTHHSMIDRVWWMWQMLSPETRTTGASAIAGAVTLNDQYEPHRNGTLEDLMDLGYVVPGKTLKIGDALDTTSGMFCYVYV